MLYGMLSELKSTVGSGVGKAAEHFRHYLSQTIYMKQKSHVIVIHFLNPFKFIPFPYCIFSCRVKYQKRVKRQMFWNGRQYSCFLMAAVMYARFSYFT